jgi:hypothetical protein
MLIDLGFSLLFSGKSFSGWADATIRGRTQFFWMLFIPVFQILVLTGETFPTEGTGNIMMGQSRDGHTLPVMISGDF